LAFKLFRFIGSVSLSPGGFRCPSLRRLTNISNLSRLVNTLGIFFFSAAETLSTQAVQPLSSLKITDFSSDLRDFLGKTGGVFPDKNLQKPY
ncbi:hypothetical protein, partial [Leptolyngbya sp. CCY15150]|uniref:hypothetical protein n=1 Tax=Leptolyngbya sp. CCY15150 TaxID=2767772 RepID=UPI00194E93B7